MFVLAVSCRYKPDGKSDGNNGNIDISTGHCLNWFADLDGDPKNGCEYRCPVEGRAAIVVVAGKGIGVSGGAPGAGPG